MPCRRRPFIFAERQAQRMGVAGASSNRRPQEAYLRSSSKQPWQDANAGTFAPDRTPGRRLGKLAFGTRLERPIPDHLVDPARRRRPHLGGHAIWLCEILRVAAARAGIAG